MRKIVLLFAAFFLLPVTTVFAAPCMDNGYERLGGVALFMRETIDSDTLVIETQTELNRIAAQDASEKTFRKLIIEVDAAEVPYGAFDGCKSLEKVIFEKDVAFIGGSAFARCFQLKTVTFEGRGPERMHDTFMFCRSLEYIRLPEGLRELDSGVFYECTALSYVGLPASLEW
ncbi:MAG: leucine-rich repeat domain-containing protein, partial [Clostridia bacterium]|nr:leucine-rich repeat domain-containing protein [Clostridia bacterium]